MTRLKDFVAILVYLLLVPFCLIRTLLFVVLHWRMFLIGRICVFYHHSFGHCVSGLDYVSRLFYPNRIALLYVGSPGANPYLPHCFAHNLVVYKLVTPTPILRWRIPKLNYFFARMACHMIAAVFPTISVIERTSVYKTLSLARGTLRVGIEREDREISADDWTGYLHLLHNRIGERPSMPKLLIEECERQIRKKYPEFFGRPLVTLLLRRKGKGGDFDNSLRSAGPQPSYLSAVEYFGAAGYNVAGTGETDHEVFSKVPHYYSLRGADLPPKLLNLYLLTRCSIFVGQQSGPSVLPNTMGIVSLICEAFPHRLGTFCPNDILLFKHLRLASGRTLSLVELFRDHLDLILGYGFGRKSVHVVPNSAEELLSGAREIVAIHQGRLEVTEDDRALIDRFLQLVPETTTLRYQKNRTTLDALRNVKAELLAR